MAKDKLQEALENDFVNKGTPIPEWVKALCHQAGSKIDFDKLQPAPEEPETEEEQKGNGGEE